MKKLLFIISCIMLLNAESFTTYDRVEVSYSEPVYRTVTVNVPTEECWDEEVEENDDAGALIGGIAGGIIGHQVGKGGGKTAATVGGAILGTIIGKNLSDKEPTYRVERRCKKRYLEKRERRLVGYNNYARYKGREIVKFSKQRLHSIDIAVTVEY